MAGGQTYSGRFRVPVLSKTEWAELDGQLSTILAPWHQQLASATSHNISTINDLIIEDIRAFLITKPDLFLENQKPSSAGFCSRESRSLKQLRDLRRRLGKEAHRPGATPEARREWRACVRAIRNVNKRDE